MTKFSENQKLSAIIAFVSFQIAGHQTESYKVCTEVYEGPLDLLLELIERAELDITRLALAQVTDHYLSYLSELQDRDPAEVSAFLVIATRLVQIKSSVLLPQAPPIESTKDEEEDPGEALAQQLIQYKRFKDLAHQFQEREIQGLKTYLRVVPLQIKPQKTDIKADFNGLTLVDFIQAARQAFFYKTPLPGLSKVVNFPRITIREKINSIMKQLKRSNQSGQPIKFQTFLKSQSRIEIVVSFLAMLELIKRHIIDAHQENLFGEISLEARQDALEKEENIEVEFKE